MRRLVCRLAAVIASVAIFSAGSLPGVGKSEAQAYFSISEDGFSISNAPGYCFAMAAFSRWYYLNKAGEPPLRKALPPDVQQRIAGELQRFYSNHLVTLQANYCNAYHSDPTESFQRFVTGLRIGDPRLVLLMNKSGRGAVLHAVLAYDWIPDKNLVKIYDPNYPHEVRTIDLERKEYTSLDITYSAICFPEVLNDHKGLVRKMESLYDAHAAKKSAAAQRQSALETR